MNIFDFDPTGIFSFTVPPLELMLRGTLLYWFLIIVLRFIQRRDAAQNGMIGGATSVTDGMVLIGTLGFWSHLPDYASFQFPLIQRFTSAPRLWLVREGKMLRRNMRREFITDDELKAKIRHERVEDIASVKRMYLEADGEMSLIRRDKPGATA